MAVSNDIFRAWLRPRPVMRRLLDTGRREDRALILLMAACLLMFVAQMPLAARLAQIDDTIPLDARLQTNFYLWVLVMPIMAYCLALVLFWILRIFTAKADAYKVRLGFFWTLLALTPANLLYGLCTGFLGDHPGTIVTGIAVVAGFFWIGIQSQREGLADV